ncbi:MAG TPA: hypothetical protein VL944_00635 [Candidatus Acidoferrum sp.]|nr:hypothetical protein [Candidatus Acidoferrum sp.]
MAEKSPDTAERLSRIYLAIISRYKDYIEEKENISVAELPTLITPKNGAVAVRADQLKSSFGAYDYSKNFEEASKKAFSFVKDEVEEALLPLQFWLVPEETLAFMMGDTFDRNILLCSMLINLGNPSAKVLVVVDGEIRRLSVYYEFNNSVVMFHLDDGIKKFESKEKMIESLGTGDEVTAYEFNDKTYRDIV